MTDIGMAVICERMARIYKNMARTNLWGGVTFITLGLLTFGIGIGVMLSVHAVYAVYALLGASTVGVGMKLLTGYRDSLDHAENWKNRAEWWRNNG